MLPAFRGSLKRGKMKLARFTLTLSIGLVVALSAKAQDAKPADTPASTAPVANPVSSTVKQQLTRFSKNMVAAAEAMPAEKYNFKPTPEMNTFAHLTIHIAQGNVHLCSKISGTAAPEAAKLTETDSKDKLVAALKASFDFCSTALAAVDDSKLSDPLTLFGSFPSSRAGALIALSDGFSDHYGAQAIYLRLNGILPPTAKPKQ
jgi:hypothetical protein